MWYLSVEQRDGGQKQIVLSGQEVTIGRDDDNDVVIDSTSVSRLHAKLFWNQHDDSWTFTDMGSRNGSSIDGEVVPPSGSRVLRPGQRVKVGRVALRIEFAPNIDEPDDPDDTTEIGQSPISTLAPQTVSISKGRRRERNARRFLGSAIAITAAYAVANTYVIRSSSGRPWMNPVMYVAGLLMLVAGLGLVLWCGFSMRTVGLTLRRWRVAIKESLIISAALVLIAALSKVLLLQTGAIRDDTFLHNARTHLSLVGLAIYIVSAFIQEFVARGIMVSGIEEVYEGKYDTLVAVVLSSLLFGVIHLFISLTFFLVTFLAGIVFASIFVRHRSLIGVTIVHFVGGLSVMTLFEPWILR